MNKEESPELPMEADASVVEQISQAAPNPADRLNDLDRELALALQLLRTQVCALGGAFVIVSLSFSLFVWIQNSRLSRVVQGRTQQIEQIQQSLELWMPALNELATYSSANPELRAIFTRYGLRVDDQPPPAGGSSPE